METTSWVAAPTQAIHRAKCMMHEIKYLPSEREVSAILFYPLEKSNKKELNKVKIDFFINSEITMNDD